MVSEGSNNIPRFACQPATGAVYCFPSVHTPQKAIEVSNEMSISADTLYALDLLRKKGICEVSLIANTRSKMNNITSKAFIV
jgi:alanine transaminase